MSKYISISLYPERQEKLLLEMGIKPSEIHLLFPSLNDLNAVRLNEKAWNLLMGGKLPVICSASNKVFI